jgi:hypothetical protein
MMLSLWCCWIHPHRLPGSVFSHLIDHRSVVVVEEQHEVVRLRNEGAFVTVDRESSVCRMANT